MQDTADYLTFEAGARSVGGAAYAQHPNSRLDGVVSVPGAAAFAATNAAISFVALADFQTVDFI